MRRRKRKNFTKHSPLDWDIELAPETRHGVAVISIFAVAALGFLSVAGLAGTAGKLFDDALKALFGWDRFIFPAALAFLGLRLISRGRGVTASALGLGVFLVTGNAIIHLLSLNGAAPDEVLENGGGYAGLLLSYPLTTMAGFWGAFLILSALFLIAVLVATGLSLARAGAFFTALAAGVFLLCRWLALAVRAFKPSAKNDAPDALPVGNAQGARFASRSVGDGEESEIEETGDNKNVLSARVPTAEAVRPKPRAPTVLPSFELLNSKAGKPTSGDIKLRQHQISATLEHFGIPVEMGEVSVGPTVTQFTLKPAEGIKLSRITALANDLALSLAAHPLRIEAPIPGKSLVGIEVPNQSVAIVPLREVLESKEFTRRGPSLLFALGKDVAGKPLLGDLGKMPHLLVAGATGSGKSVCLNSIIMSLLFANGPEDVKFLLIDPKRVEMPIYNGMPHLVSPVVTEAPKIVNALKWALREMERRFELLSKFGKRDIGAWNREMEEKLPYLIIVIDELADLMVAAASEVEGAIIRLAQMSRAVGIHLIVATQRPSVDVITGLIKANITARVAFAVASLMDSRTILDCAGAEKLLGRGDMLFLSAELSKPRRIQGAFVSDAEIKNTVEFLKTTGTPIYEETVMQKPSSLVYDDYGEGVSDEPLLEEATDTITRAGKASASLLQRRLRVGYARAARLLDLLEERGIIGPPDGAKPREVLVQNTEPTQNALETERANEMDKNEMI